MSGLLVAVLAALVPVGASAAPCDAANPYCYRNSGYQSLEEAEFAMRNSVEKDWRYFLTLEKQVDNKYVYHLPPRPHLPTTPWRAYMATGTYVHGWYKYNSPVFGTWQEGEAWLHDLAARPTPSDPSVIVSDDLAYRGSNVDSYGHTIRIYSHNLTSPPVSLVKLDISDNTFPWNCTYYSTGTEDAVVSRLVHGIQFDPNNPIVIPGILVSGTVQTCGSHHIKNMPSVGVQEFDYSYLCDSPYGSDGTQCVSSVREYITYGPTHVLEAPDQSDCDSNKTNPCNPANGVKTQVETDFVIPGSGGLEFKRYYRSRGPHKTDTRLQAGWRHTYSRRIDERPDTNPQVTFAVPLNQSSAYWSEADACTQGFDEINRLCGQATCPMPRHPIPVARFAKLPTAARRWRISRSDPRFAASLIPRPKRSRRFQGQTVP